MSLAEILTRKKRSSTFLNSCCLGKNVWWVTTNFQARREGGATGVLAPPLPPPPQAPEVHLIIDQQLKTKWSIVEYCSILIYWLCTKIENAVKKGHKPDSPFPQNVFSPS